MREIKFRGKRVDNGEWVYGDIIHSRREPWSIVRDYGETGVSIYNIDPKTVGQYTGLKDKNGREIYESDLIFDGKQTWLVEYSQIGCGFHARDIHAKRCNIFSLYHLCNRHNDKREVEVIGNIFENGDLLNGQQ